MVLFGDLEVKQSFGSASIQPPPCFIDDNSFCFAQGHVVQLRQLSNSDDEYSMISNGNGLNYRCGNNSITCIAANTKEGILSLAEKGSSDIHLLTLPNLKYYSQKYLTGSNDDETIQLCFTSDSKLISLGGHKTYSIIIWDWKKGTILAQTSCGKAVSYLSVNPMNSHQICTGGPGFIQFWWLKEGYKKYTLKQTSRPSSFLVLQSVKNNTLEEQEHESGAENSFNHGATLFKVQETMDINVSPCWTDKSQVLVLTNDRKLYQIDPNTNDCSLLMSLPKEWSIGDVTFTKDGVLIASNDGAVHFQSCDSEKSYDTPTEWLVKNNCRLKKLFLSPDHRFVGIISDCGEIFSFNRSKKDVLQHSDSAMDVLHLDIIHHQNQLITIDKNGLVSTFDAENCDKLSQLNLKLKDITAAAFHHFGNLVLFGTGNGVLRVWDRTNEKWIYRKRLFKTAIKSVIFDSSQKYVAVFGEEDSAAIFLFHSQFAHIGYLKMKGRITSGHFYNSEDEKDFLYLLILTRIEADNTSYIYRYTLPAADVIKAKVGKNPFSLGKESLTTVAHRIEDLLCDICSVPSHLANGKKSFVAFCSDLTLRLYPFPPKKGNDERSNDATLIPLNSFSVKAECHFKNPSQFCHGDNREWLISYSTDGNLTVRSFLELDRFHAIMAHDSYIGGVQAVTATRDLKYIYTLGHDGQIRCWDWKYTPAGKREAANAAAEYQNWCESTKENIEKFSALIAALDPVENVNDFADEVCLIDENENAGLKDVVSTNESQIESFKTALLSKVSDLKERIVQTMKINKEAPELERLDDYEFIINEEEKDRLEKEAIVAADALRQQISNENDQKMVLYERLKKELWESMDVIGKSVKSFYNQPSSNNRIIVDNHPLRKLTEKESNVIEKVILLRKTQMFVEESLVPKKIEKGKNDENNLDDANTTDHDNISINKYENSKLLFSSFNLWNRERVTIQIVLLSSIIRKIKISFNQRFETFVNLKREEIIKIEDKNDRIKEILKELAIDEEIFHAILDDEEIPEKVVTIDEKDIKSTKFLGAEERKKVEEQKRQEQARKLAEKEDNWKERALMTMMNGKLEDRSQQQEVDVIIPKPECYGKPKNELSEEEKKLIKEYEKKLSIQKEEQEKHRKALETELRKIQSLINEICQNFDTKLAALLQEKIKTDHLIHQLELYICKLQKALVYQEDHNTKESALLNRLNDLKQERINCANEIPEIKKDLEHCREDYEAAVKRDKEFEKLFKKEFHNYEFYYETLWRLFKRRDQLSRFHDQRKDSESDDIEKMEKYNPFEIGTDHGDFVATPLNRETDMPEGLPKEVWTKLVEFRDKKIQLEQDVKNTSRKFTEMQNLVTMVVHESERIKTETDLVTEDYQNFLEYEFLCCYDIEALFQLKQGLVEVLPQAAVLTDYTNAVLIHRSVVEQLNDEILNLGKLKVEALVEMKNYRKGIHALEWENKVLDFQADNLINRTRDIQLLRVTKQMQDYIRSGDETKQTVEVNTLEKRMEHGAKTHRHKVEEKMSLLDKLNRKIKQKMNQNNELDGQLGGLSVIVNEREQIHAIQSKNQSQEQRPAATFQYLRNRTILMDEIKTQHMDLEILKQERDRLKMKTIPKLNNDFQKQVVMKTNMWSAHVKPLAGEKSVETENQQ